MQGSGSVMTELGKADGFMTHCLDDTFTKPGLQDSRGRRLGARKGETCWKLSRLGKMIGRRPLMREVSADIHFQAVALLKGRDFRDRSSKSTSLAPGQLVNMEKGSLLRWLYNLAPMNVTGLKGKRATAL